MSPHYKIQLTDKEFRAIQFMVDRGYFPKTTYLEMFEVCPVCSAPLGELSGDVVGCSVHGIRERGHYAIPEWAAWTILDDRKADPDSLFACAGPELLAKLLKLEEEIVHSWHSYRPGALVG